MSQTQRSQHISEASEPKCKCMYRESPGWGVFFPDWTRDPGKQVIFFVVLLVAFSNPAVFLTPQMCHSLPETVLKMICEKHQQAWNK